MLYRCQEHLVCAQPARRTLPVELRNGQAMAAMLKLMPLPQGVTAIHMALLEPKVKAIIGLLHLDLELLFSIIFDGFSCPLLAFWWLFEGFVDPRIKKKLPPTLSNITEALRQDNIGLSEAF